MIGIDTNIIVRYLVQDDARQAAQASHLLNHVCSEENPAFVSLITVVETVWVLGAGYHYSKAEVLFALENLLRATHLRFEQEELLWRAWYSYRQGNADFVDYLMAQIYSYYGCQTTFTFDRKAAQHDAFTLLTEMD